MNAHNNESDPLENVFRDRFADFESEPDTQLWQRIKPQLPVNPMRKFPYWQTSVVMMLLLLVGLWTYREKYSDDVVTKSDDSKPEKIAKSEVNQIKKRMSSDYRLTEPNPTQNLDTKYLTTNDLMKNTTKNIKSGNHINIIELPPLLSVSSQTTKSIDKPALLEKTIETIKLSVSPLTTDKVQPIQNNEDKDLTVNDLTKNTANHIDVKSKEKAYTEKPWLKESFAWIETTAENKTKKTSLFSNPNTTTEQANTSLEKGKEIIAKEKNNFSNNSNGRLNLFSANNSNKKLGIISENVSNNSNISSVFSGGKQVSGLNKNYLVILDPKSYSLLRNHFKTPRLKFVVATKKDDYFKERKPLEMYASVMPLLNYYTITPNGNDANYVHSIAVNNDDDRLGFYTQAGVIFTLSNKFKLRTGLTFTKTNHSINYQIRTDSLVVQPSDNKGVDVSFAELNKTYSQSANYLGTKIEVQYIFLEGEALTHYLNVGLEGAYRLNGIKQFNGFANFAYGVTRQIGDNAYLFIEPTFSYSLNQQSDNNSFLLVKPNKIGFNIGVNFKIK
jgi:hypothetical protein